LFFCHVFFTDFFVIPARSYLPSQPLISTAAAFLNPAVAKRCEFKGQIFDPWKYPGVCALFKIICGELWGAPRNGRKYINGKNTYVRRFDRFVITLATVFVATLVAGVYKQFHCKPRCPFGVPSPTFATETQPQNISITSQKTSKH